MKCLDVGHRRQASLFHNFLKYKEFSLWRDGERLGKGCSWGAIFPSANFGGRPLTQDSVGQPFGVLSFLSYSQTLGPPPPFSADSLFRSVSPGVRAQPWGCAR